MKGPWTSKLALLALLALPGHVLGQEAEETAPPLGDRVARVTLVRAADRLAGIGRAGPAREVLEIAAALGHPEKDVKRALAAVEKKLAKAKPSTKVSGAVKSIRKAIGVLDGSLATAEGERKAALCRLILRLDGEHGPAHEALGHVKRPDGWAAPDEVPLLERREAIRNAIEEARRLEVPVKFSDGGSKILAKVTGAKVRQASWGKVHVHATHLDDHKLARVLRSAVRAGALSRFVLQGDLRLPELSRDTHLSVFPNKPAFREGVEEAANQNRLSRAEAKIAVNTASWLVNGGERLMASITEAGMSTWLLGDIIREGWYVEHPGKPQPSLDSGHQNWVARTFLGAGVRYAAVVARGERSSGETSDRRGRELAPEDMWRLADAGIAGSRTWMRYLVERGEDPAWAASFEDQLGKIQGDDLLKATFVVEHLQEAGTLLAVMSKTAGKKTEAPTFEAAIGESLAAFEERWRRWIADSGSPSGVLQRLSAKRKVEDPAEQALLEHLDSLRTRAIDDRARQMLLPLGIDEELSAGCRAHASYLVLNPEQIRAWPDAHEEWPDREGFSVAGSWSGQHSVVVGGVKDARQAIDAWMGTFYHRVPLIHPGLVRIGYGFEKGVAVLDTNSMVGPFVWEAWAVWPAPDATGVPRRFNPELPNPVPGADQSAWGYPITLQLLQSGPDDSVRISLHEGSSAGGDAVDCHLSTPNEPTNPDLAPADVWCLIPKAHLKPRATYTVVARDAPFAGHETIQWSFTTGK